MRIRLSSILLMVFLFTGCGPNKPETPNEAIQAIIHLYEQQDFDTLIRTRYAEIDKAENEEQVKKLVNRFATRFSNEGKRNEVIAVFQSLLPLTPEISDDGSVATYKLDGRSFRLLLMPNGQWGFTQ